MSDSIRIFSDWSAVERELDRLIALPGPGGFSQLDAVLETGFAATQAVVHIRTASLKMSGKVDVEPDGDKWAGQIEYGGVSGGVNDPVDYAIYEKARGGAHNFMAPTEALPPLLEHAVKEILLP